MRNDKHCEKKIIDSVYIIEDIIFIRKLLKILLFFLKNHQLIEISSPNFQILMSKINNVNWASPKIFIFFNLPHTIMRHVCLPT